MSNTTSLQYTRLNGVCPIDSITVVLVDHWIPELHIARAFQSSGTRQSSYWLLPVFVVSLRGQLLVVH
ncbi:hypothetical protein BVRB_5g111600 [Beta vulgaris subsp. vulgaris]|nr:hypothetical protein BVRB_5g111600 [Beta vulgaris subsp. vulgaris]